MERSKFYKLPFSVFLATFILLSIVQLKMTENPILIAERFVKGLGWVQIFMISLYGSFVAFKMQKPQNVPKWRNLTWSLFSVVFFSQLLLGLLGAEKFLMTGKLHLPIPMMILAGPINRMELSFMTFLFLSTIILTGPAWCSQLCYFGAIDNIASRGKTKISRFKFRYEIKATILVLIIIAALILRWLKVNLLFTTIIAGVFGLLGLVVILLFSRKQKRMVHCTLYCPIGTLVNLLKPINPFRIDIDSSCDLCMKCSTHCKYDALRAENIKNKKPGFNCTYCGDCLTACHHQSIKYRFFKLNPYASRNLYLFLTITLHAVFLALAKI